MPIKRLKLKQPPGLTKRVLELGVSGGVLGNYMKSHNWAGTTIPFPFLVVIFYWNADDPYLPYYRVHEFTHVQQDEQARWWFVAWARYAWQMVKHFALLKVLTRKESISDAMMDDYMANEYEQAAYAVEDEAFKNGLPDWAK